MSLKVILSCEHATNAIPEAYKYLFEHAEKDLNSHKGWDPGAYEVMIDLAEALQTSSFYFDFTRLLIEPNRSLDHPQLFSFYSNKLDEFARLVLIDKYYHPYRDQLESEIAKSIHTGSSILHLSIHSFTPVFEGEIRKTDVGILFDPERKQETTFSSLLKNSLENYSNDLQVDENLPYKGIDDGFTTYLRTKFDDPVYAGIELEVNQRFLSDGFESIRQIIREAVTIAVNEYENRRTGNQTG